MAKSNWWRFRVINYLAGDATCPQVAGNKIICHVCNDIGGWGRGFVVAISRRWPEPEADYRAWYKARSSDFALGNVRFVPVEEDLVVANMIAQHGVRSKGNKPPPIRYDAIRQCLAQMTEKALGWQASVHMPRIGCGLAGGDWGEIESIIEETLISAGVAVYIYDFG